MQEPLNNSNGESVNSNGSRRAKAIAYGKKVSKFRRRAAQQKSEILLTDRARRGADSTLYEEKVGAERVKSRASNSRYAAGTVKLPRLFSPKESKDAPMLGKTVEFMPQNSCKA